MSIIRIKVESAIDVNGFQCGKNCSFFSIPTEDRFFCELFGLDLAQSRDIVEFSVDRCEPCIIAEADSEEVKSGN